LLGVIYALGFAAKRIILLCVQSRQHNAGPER